MDAKDDVIHFIAENPKNEIQRLQLRNGLGTDIGEIIINFTLAPSVHHFVCSCNNLAMKDKAKDNLFSL